VLGPLSNSLTAHYAKALDMRFWQAGKDEKEGNEETLLLHLDKQTNATPPGCPS
jgi:hypothetical protein